MHLPFDICLRYECFMLSWSHSCHGSIGCVFFRYFRHASFVFEVHWTTVKIHRHFSFVVFCFVLSTFHVPPPKEVSPPSRSIWHAHYNWFVLCMNDSQCVQMWNANEKQCITCLFTMMLYDYSRKMSPYTERVGGRTGRVKIRHPPDADLLVRTQPAQSVSDWN